MRHALAAILVLSAIPAVSPALPAGQLVEGVKCEVDPTQTYTLYLPGRHTPEKSWPGLLIFDPRGRSVMAAELFRDAAEIYGWVILSSNDTRSDGPMEPNQKALAALWPEVHTHYSVDFRRIYVAGFSGGAMLGWALGRQTGELAGVIGSGGRLEARNLNEKIDFPCFGAAGDTDFNYGPMRQVHEQLARRGTPERLEIFEGPHGWMPAELAREGVEWMELQAMKQGLRERDAGLIEELFRQDAAKALALESKGRGLAAMRRYAAIADSYDGLRDVDSAKQAAARLAERAEVKEARDEEKDWDSYEALYQQRMGSALARLSAEPGFSTRQLAAELRLAELERRAREPSYEGVVARRLLETVLTHTSFYLTRDFFARKDYRSAVKVLTVASEIRPQRADVWYNLACALAHSSSKKKALEALERAVDAGFSNAAQMASDPDLESLRGDDGFRQLVGRLGG